MPRWYRAALWISGVVAAVSGLSLLKRKTQ